MRLGDLDALKKAVENLVVGGAEGLKDYYENGSKSDENSWIGGVYDAWELINNAPTVNLEKTSFMKGYNYGCDDGKRFYERPQGKWIEKYSDYGVYYRCSNCHKMPPNYECDYKESAIKTNFCPNCGAKMKSEEE